MRIALSFVAVLVVACHSAPESPADASPRSPGPAPSASASEIPSASDDGATTRGDAATADLPAPTGTCSLSEEERRALQKCLWSLVSYRVGIRGTFGIRVKMTRDASGAVHAASRVDEEAWRDAPAGTCLADVAQAFASDAGKPLPCSWAAKGPYPTWTIAAD